MVNWVSVDGFFAGPNGEMDWIVRDTEVDKAIRESGNSERESGNPDTMLLGNVTYTMFENSWPHVAKDSNAPEEMRKMADEVTRMTKVVFSQTRKEVVWDNSKLLGGNLVEEVGKLKRDEGTDIMIFGSGTIVRQLTNEGLIDEYLIAVTPVVLGTGKPLYGDVKRLNLRLLDSKHFKSGNVLLRYGTDKSPG